MTRHAHPSKDVVMVTYKPDFEPSPQERPYFHLFADPNELDNWKKGGKKIPLSQVLDSITIYVTRAKTGIFEQPSKAELEHCFHTDNLDDVMELILEAGKIEHLNHPKIAELYEKIHVK